MSKKVFGMRVRSGSNNIEDFMTIFAMTAERIKKMLELKDITPEYKFTGIEIVDNKDYSYSIMFNFDDELSIKEIFDRAITGGE